MTPMAARDARLPLRAARWSSAGGWPAERADAFASPTVGDTKKNTLFQPL